MAMGNCRICFQFRNVDESHICERCEIKHARHLATKVRLVFYKNRIRPENCSTGKILSKDDWFYIKRHIDDFFNSVSSDDIDWMNRDADKAISLKKKITSGYVYLMQADNGYYKIGRALDVSKRNKEHMRDYPIVIKVLHSFFCRNYVKAESQLLKMFEDKRLQGEWFALEKPDVDYIMGITDEIAQRLF